jgi:two-component sensor histidine kinase
MVGVVFDTTDVKLKDAKTAALLKLGDQLRDASTVQDITRAAAEILAGGLSASRAGYSTVDQPGEHLIVEFDWTSPGTQSIAGRHSLKSFSATIKRLAKGGSLVVEDIASTDWLDEDCHAYGSIGTHSLIKVPVLENGVLVAILFAHDDKPRSWEQDDVDFAQGVADRTYAAVAKVQAEAERELLTQELSHRLKNTLAMVMAIAGQTLKDVTEREAVDAFTARLQALSQAHDVLLRQNWSSAKIGDVMRSVFALHVNDDARLRLIGPDLSLGPKAGLSLSLLLHELATNAFKYGALSNDSGVVAVEWQVDDLEGVQTLSMTWSESGGPIVGEPTRRGFGSRLIRMGIAGAGNADKSYLPSGLTATFRAPMAMIQELGS